MNAHGEVADEVSADDDRFDLGLSSRSAVEPALVVEHRLGTTIASAALVLDQFSSTSKTVALFRRRDPRR